MDQRPTRDAIRNAAIDELRVYLVCPGPDGGAALTADPSLCAHATVENSRNADGVEVETETSDSPRLVRFQAMWDSGEFPALLCDALLTLRDAGSDLVAVRSCPPIHPMTPGTFRTCMQFDLSDRAVELLTAAGAGDLRWV